MLVLNSRAYGFYWCYCLWVFLVILFYFIHFNLHIVFARDGGGVKRTGCTIIFIEEDLDRN